MLTKTIAGTAYYSTQSSKTSLDDELSDAPSSTYAFTATY